MEQLTKYENNINEQIKLYNLEFKKHFFNYDLNNNNSDKDYYEFKSFDDSELYKFSRLFDNSLRTYHMYKKINKKDNIKKILKFSSFNCRHLFHDDNWLKFNSNNFICDIEDDYKEIYCNTINKADMKTKEFLDFASNIEKNGYKLKYLDFDENDEDTYNNDLLMWVILPLEKNEN